MVTSVPRIQISGYVHKLWSTLCLFPLLFLSREFTTDSRLRPQIVELPVFIRITVSVCVESSFEVMSTNCGTPRIKLHRRIVTRRELRREKSADKGSVRDSTFFHPSTVSKLRGTRRESEKKRRRALIKMHSLDFSRPRFSFRVHGDRPCTRARTRVSWP